MRILIVSQYFWPENFRINDIALGLKEQGNEVVILTGKPNYPQGVFYKGYSFTKPYFEYYEGIEIYRVPFIPRGKDNRVMLALNYLSFALFGCIWGLWLLRKKNFDSIFVFGISPITMAIPAIFLKKIKNANLIYWVQDLWPESISSGGNINNKFIYLVADWITKFVYKNSDMILAQSKGFVDAIQKHNVPPKKIKYYPNYAENIYAKKTIDEKVIHPTIPEGFIVMFAGNIGEAQGFKTIVEAANKVYKENKEIYWVIIGAGRKKEWVDEQIKNYGLSDVFLFLGSYPSEKMPYFFNLSDTLLVSLKDDYIFSLTIPSKLQSYMAFGKPIIASLNGEPAQIINDAKCGLVSNSNDSENLAFNVLKMSKYSKDTLNEMGENAKKYCEDKFNRKKLLLELNELFLLSKKL